MIGKNLWNILGTGVLEIRKAVKKHEVGSQFRPIGKMDLLLQDLVKRGLQCSMIVDVGANCTNWSRMAKKIFPDASICLIEPQIEMKDQLERFCKENQGSRYFLAGAGAEPSMLTFTIWNDLAGSSFLPKPDDELKGCGRQREVEIITIDDLIATDQIAMPELIKLDIQGYELEALKGASRTFGRTDVYIIEASLFPFSDLPELPTLCDVINFMRDRDYVVYDFGGFLRRPLDGALGQCDVCFVKKDGFLRRSFNWS